MPASNIYLNILGDLKRCQDLSRTASNLTSAFCLNNNHLHLMVHWAGKNSAVVFVLARDQDLTVADATSNFYISRDYGKTFEDVSDNFKVDGKTAVLEKFYNHPESPCHYVVTDTLENVSF